MRNDHGFRERVDRSLSALTWDGRGREAVLRAIDKEEGNVKKKLFTTLLIAALVACLGVSALAAAGLIFNPRVDAARLADRALEAKYGVTRDMLGYFDRTVEEQDDGVTVTYRGAGVYEYVLGEYTVTVKDGSAVASWSHDGEDTGFDGPAWGAEQLAVMAADAKVSRNGDRFAPKAAELTAELSAGDRADPEGLAQGTLDGAERARLVALAKDAVREVYGLTEAQLDALQYVEELSGFLPAGKDSRRVYNVNLQLMQDQSPDESGMTEFIEGDGSYDVAVDIAGNAIESVSYDSGLAGNG